MKRMIIVAVFCLVCNALMAQSPIYQHGNKVYIPYSDKDVAQKAGAMKLSELITKNGLWNVVDKEEDAQFILDFVYSEEGIDHGFVNIKDRNGKLIAPTPKEKDSNNDPVEKGETIAEATYDKYVSKIGTELKIEDGRLLISGRRRGFVLRPEIGVGADYDLGSSFNHNFNDMLYSYGVTIAYQFNPFISAGVKLGKDFDNEYNFLSFNGSHSICLNFRTYFCEKPWSPFFDLESGIYYFNKDRYDDDDDYDEYYDDDDYKPNYKIRALVGVQYKKIDLGCSYTLISSIEESYWSNYTFRKEDYYISINVAYNFQLKKKLK